LNQADLDFQAAFGHDSDIFTLCVELASTSLGSSRVAALSLFSNVVGLNSKFPKFISLNLFQRLLAVLDATQAVGDVKTLVQTLIPNSSKRPQTTNHKPTMASAQLLSFFTPSAAGARFRSCFGCILECCS